jgi:hypothetical protein
MLDDGRIVGETALKGRLRFRRLADANVLDVGSTEDDVLVHLVTGGHGSVGRTVLGTERTNFGKRDCRFLRVDGVENALIANFRLGDQADLGPQVGNSCVGHLSNVFPDRSRRFDRIFHMSFVSDNWSRWQTGEPEVTLSVTRGGRFLQI